MFSRGNEADGEGAVLGVLRQAVQCTPSLEVSPDESTHVPREPQGLSVGYKVLWPKYVSATLDFEQSSFTRHFSGCKYVPMPGKSAEAGTELAAWPRVI